MIKKYMLILLCFVSMSLSAHEVVLITGATQGIGLKTAEKLALAGYVVYGTYRATSDLEGLTKAMTRSRGRLFKVLMDVCDDASVERAVNEVLQKEGTIDILINNAGALVYGSWESTSIEQARYIFDVNYFGPMRVIQALLPSMREKKKGHIVNISSRSAFRPLPSLSVYAASKAALTASSEALAASLTDWNIFISCVEPGPVQTSLDAHALLASRFPSKEDPYLPLFEEAGYTLKQSLTIAQPVDEVAEVVLEAIQSSHPFFRYQTSSLVKKQAALRARDITGQTGLKELKKAFINR